MSYHAFQPSLLGHFASIEDLFTESSFEAGGHAKTPGFYFLGGLPNSVNIRYGFALFVRPTREVLVAAPARCCNGQIGSFQAARSDFWTRQGLLPIWCHDAYHIAHFLVATVPAAEYHRFAER